MPAIIKAGFIVGAGGGSGTLHFQGHTYRPSVGDLSLGTLGVAGADLVGTATNLHRLQDIAGVTQETIAGCTGRAA